MAVANQKNQSLIYDALVRQRAIQSLLASLYTDYEGEDYEELQEYILPPKDANKQNKLEEENYHDEQPTFSFSFDFVAFVERILEPRASFSQARFLSHPWTFLLSKIQDVASHLWIKSYGAHLRIKRNVQDTCYLTFKALKKVIVKLRKR